MLAIRMMEWHALSHFRKKSNAELVSEDSFLKFGSRPTNHRKFMGGLKNDKYLEEWKSV